MSEVPLYDALKDFRAENYSSQGKNLAVTILFMPSSLDTASKEYRNARPSCPRGAAFPTRVTRKKRLSSYTSILGDI